MKIAIRLILVVAFICSFFYFLSKPVNAFTSSTATISEAIEVVSEVNSQMGLTPYCWYMTAPTGQVPVAIIIYYSNYLWTGWDTDLTMRCPMGRYNTNNSLMYNSTNSVLLVKYNSTSKWGSTVNTAQHPSLSADFIQPSDLLSGDVVNFSWWSYTTRYLNGTGTIDSQVFSYRPVFWSPNTGVATFDCTPTNALCTSMGFNGVDVTTGSTIFGGAPEYLAPPPPETNYQYYLEYYDSDFTDGYIRIDTDDIIELNPITATGEYPFIFSGDYSYSGMSTSGFSISTPAESPPSIEITDLDEPCLNIKASNLYIKDTNGTYICSPIANVIVENLVPPYVGVINYDTATDLGMFEPLEPVIVWFTSAIDDVVGWFYGLWSQFVNLIVPSPNFLAFFSQSIKTAFEDVVDVASFTAFTDDFTALQDEDESEMPTLTGTIMGVEVPLIDFSIIKDNINIIRGITITFLTLYIAYFNINAITLILNNKRFLSRE